MALPDPQPGLVLRYAYLWRSEADRGKDEGVKDRPVVVVLAVKRDGNHIRVVVAPVTHTPPTNVDAAVEIPPQTKSRLGLDDAPSWIVTSELNHFNWPGPDLRPIDPKNPARGVVYGYLSNKLYERVRDSVLQQRARQQIRAVNRDE
jgi:hypothetical protein